ncbi:MAG: I78 family peptidase inhibitor [Thermomonas sp.]
MSMPTRLLGLSATALLISACVTPATPPSATACNAEAVQSFVGRTATGAVVDAARSAAGAELVRVIKPGQAVTMDFRGERLNLYLDDAGAVARASCG